MNILFVSDCYPSVESPQYCIFLEQQAIALKNLSHKVEVLVPQTSIKNKSTETFHGIKVTRIPITKPSKIDMFFKTSENPLLFTEYFKNFDVVSFHFGNLKILRAVIRACKKTNTKLVMHFHGLNVWHELYEPHKFLSAIIRHYKKQAYSKLDAVVGVSDKVRQNFSEVNKNVPAFTVYNGVDTELFKASDHIFTENNLSMICSANMIDIKGEDYLIKAAAALIKKGYSINLSLAGRGPNKEKYENLCRTLKINDYVNFLGYLHYDELAKITAEKDVFIMPSYYEALGCVYLEAMSAGLITVGVKGQGIDEIIVPGENGFLVDPKSVESIEKTLESIYKMSDAEKQRISKNARASAKNYTWKASALALENVYKEIFKGEKHVGL